MNEFAVDHLQQKLLETKYFWLLFRRGVTIKSVQIFTQTITTKVAINHSVWVDHWHNIKYKILEQFLGLGWVGKQILEDTVEHVARGDFSGMDSRTYEDTLNCYKSTLLFLKVYAWNYSIFLNSLISTVLFSMILVSVSRLTYTFFVVTHNFL